MTGIREMFAEFSGDDHDWFQMAFWFENQRRATDTDRRRQMRQRYACDSNHRARKNEYQRARYKNDPAFAAAHRQRMREYMRKRHAAKKAKKA